MTFDNFKNFHFPYDVPFLGLTLVVVPSIRALLPRPKIDKLLTFYFLTSSSEVARHFQLKQDQVT